MAIIYYLGAFLFSLTMVLLLFVLWDKKSYSYFSNIFWIVLIANGGYFSLALANSVETAVLAKKLCYVGGCFIPLLVFFNICSLCKIKISRIVSTVLTVLCLIAFVGVLSIGVSDLFYESFSLVKVNNISILDKENGPLYYLYLAELIGLNIASIVVVAISLRPKNRKFVSYINSVLLLIPLAASTLVYIIQRVTDSIIDWIPLSYMVFTTIFFIVYRRTENYDIISVVIDSYKQVESHGYIIINKNGKYLGSSEIAKTYYPLLNDLKIDYNLDDSDELFRKIKKEMLFLKENSSAVWYQVVNNKEIKFEIRHNFYKNRPNGYIIELSDDTMQQNYIKLLNNYNNELEIAVKNKTDHIQEIQNKIILGMAKVVESRDNSTGGHVKRTSDVVKIFINKIKKEKIDLGVSKDFYKNMIKAAPMHDIGKIAIDDIILRKPGKYTSEEYDIMKTHAYEGAKILDNVLAGVEDENFVKIAINVAHYHHEKYDGNGYPDKLEKENIPIEARIMALADVFDALVSKRCYKEKMSYDQAFEIIKESCGNHFDPKLGEIFIQCRDELEAYYNEIE